MYNEALIAIEDKCFEIVNKTLHQVGMIAPIRSGNDAFDRDLRRESAYDAQALATHLAEKLPQLQLQQRTVYNTIMAAITNQTGGLYFLDAPGGTGKTFVISLILAKVRTQNNI